MAKFKQSYLKPTLFKPKGHPWEGITWNVQGSKGNEYDVDLTEKGFTCNCPGFSFRGRCKHSEQILKKVERVIAWD